MSSTNRTFINNSKNQNHNYLVVDDKNTIHCDFDVTSKASSLEYSYSVDSNSNFYNFIENTKTDIRIGHGSSLTLRNANFNLMLNTVELENDSVFSFMHNGKNYSLNTRHNISEFKAQNISRSIEVAECLYAFYNNSLMNSIIPSTRAAIKFYAKDCQSESVIDEILRQNGMECKPALMNKIGEYFFENSLICKSFEGSALEVLPLEIIGKICSYTKCDDVTQE